jgi:predicted DNA-binding ribbon-helix-helix protein
LSLSALIARIDADRQMSLLASACRVRALAWARGRGERRPGSNTIP